ncbi:MAG: sigma-54-dependent transcriptional regulator [Nitrospinota bacterium]
MSAAGRKRILVVEDNAPLRETLAKMIAREDYEVDQAEDGERALALLADRAPHLILTDLRMPRMDGLQLLKVVKRLRPETEVVMLTAFGTIETAVEAVREGAYDFIEKPSERAHVLKVIRKAIEKQELRREVEELRAELARMREKGELIGASRSMRQVLEFIEQVAPSSATVLILGESGTGKELVAQAIHNLSPRARAPFVKVSCAALPETLLESELFGYERGAFTGATHRKEGRFELADGGTLFLDEIGEMSPAVQVKLLRVLQEGEFERLGGRQTLRVDVRIVAASNRDLWAAVEGKTFREDLYYRLNVISLPLPPLRERKEDIPLLVEHFIQRYAAKNGKQVEGVSREALDRLYNFDWPGNVRELENTIERAVVLTRDRVVGVEDLSPHIGRVEGAGGEGALPQGVPVVAIPVGTPLDEVERLMIEATLKLTEGDKSAAARKLGIATRTIYRKLGTS